MYIPRRLQMDTRPYPQPGQVEYSKGISRHFELSWPWDNRPGIRQEEKRVCHGKQGRIEWLIGVLEI